MMDKPISRCKVIGFIGELNRKAMSAFNQSDYGTAEFFLFQAKTMVHSLKAPVILEAKTINNLGIVLAARGQVQQADDNYRRALHLICERIGKENRLYKAVEKNWWQNQQMQIDTLLTEMGVRVA